MKIEAGNIITLKSKESLANKLVGPYFIVLEYRSEFNFVNCLCGHEQWVQRIMYIRLSQIDTIENNTCEK
jgi:hypothetical protein